MFQITVCVFSRNGASLFPDFVSKSVVHQAPHYEGDHVVEPVRPWLRELGTNAAEQDTLEARESVTSPCGK